MLKLISVSGMITENCRDIIMKRLEEEDAVQTVDVRLPKSLVEVVFDENNISLEDIKKIIHELGYDPM